MVSISKIVSMIVCVLICGVVTGIPCFMIKKRSRKLETGLLGAVCYGFLGYVWQYIFFMFFGALIVRYLGTGTAMMVVVQILLTVVTTVLTVLSLFWGIYLTNQKQRSVYRSAAIGIGFALGKMGIELIYPNLYSLYFALQINRGAYAADPKIKESILNTANITLYLDTYRCILMFLIVFALALIMGHLYLKQEIKKMAIVASCIYEVIMLVNLAVESILSGTAANVVLFIFLTVVAAAAGMILSHWFRTNEVVMNPLELLNKEK